MDNTSFTQDGFDIPSEVLDEIQKNIQDIIKNFDVPDDNKLEVIRKINFMYTHTKQMSLVDSLTKLFNRRHFENEFEREYRRAKRYNCNLSLAIIDIDFFKKVNDTYGHLCGDYVLRETAFLISNNFRHTDCVFRYGGEEFAVILTETDADGALTALERLRKTFEENRFVYNDNVLKITISAGVTSNTSFDCSDEMFEDADKALYKAKENGRNIVVRAIDKKD